MADNVPRFEARYANYFKISVNDEEFIIDFGQFHAEDIEPFWHSRIVITPAHAIRLLEMIQKALSDDVNRAEPD